MSDTPPISAPGRLPRPRRPRRTWPQRLVLGLNGVVVVACLSTALALRFAQDKLGQVQRVDVSDALAPTVPPAPVAPDTTGDDPAATTVPEGPPPGAVNYLVFGTDNRECIDPASPWAGGFLAEEIGGQRSDTIMVLRVDPANDGVTLLSLNRDLYIPISGTQKRDRINGAISGGPERLIRTISDNFGVPINHFVEVDFCAFRNIVDAIGGVAVPFEQPVRDRNTGLGVVRPVDGGCHAMDGDEALAYARSRNLEVRNPDTGRWSTDPTADVGRVRRQQDLVKRILQKGIDAGARNPVVLNRLVDAALADVTIDTQLTVRDVLSLGQAMRSFDPANVQTFTIEADQRVVQGKSVLVPRPNSLANLAVALVFQGQALPALPAPEEPADATTTVPGQPPVPSTVAPPTTAAAGLPTPTSPAVTTSPSTTSPSTTSPSTTLPVVAVPTTRPSKFVPSGDLSCR